MICVRVVYFHLKNSENWGEREKRKYDSREIKSHFVRDEKMLISSLANVSTPRVSKESIKKYTLCDKNYGRTKNDAKSILPTNKVNNTKWVEQWYAF